ncbi:MULTISPECIES: ATP-dependent helicase C-terminal domain-containing protein [Streptomyces]|uniref:ATP-dependent helicase C-terminal domain-containing protein n=1 Tax=Streptomyces TaxID=1883 RepID=UPI000A3BF2E2|nr:MULTISPECIES: ATP-dependent helicase C-terminal domain-containing protein [Streptomyces]MDI3095643.1 ATP-dependent helicase C-terminal domain-containing protein [Streptomyces sp. AN-3]WDI17871.1 ATP-dependent helicase C-terminal domain-containing protein [Streptomyces enissocaesilis]
MIRYDALEALPVRGALPALHDALEGHGTAVLVAPPGTGKTTLVPLALAGLLGEGPARRVVVAEPRRIAARAAARRMAWLLGEKPGGSVGYTVRGERVVGRPGRVEVVTTGVLLQRLQRDQELTGVDVVVLDECHERHLDADTTAAFLWDVRQALRPELRLVAASATTDAEGWARLLGDAPVVEARGASYPVEVVWAPPARPVRPPHGMRVDPALLAHVASVVRRALAERDGDVLCFLPGVGEIARVAGQLTGLGDVDVLQVHGRAPAAVQDAVLAPGTRRRVVLATAVAESSLTVPGVRVVVDAGLAREPRVDHARGLSALTTVRASRAAGRQRAGRAGREAPGTVYRCWAEAEDARLPRFPAPEIEVADLTAFALQAACWGDPDASGLALLDPPPRGAMAAARSVLTAVGAVDGAGRATERGARLARLGVHPRLGRALLDAGGEDRPGSPRALLSDAGSGGGAGSGRGAGSGTGREHGSGTRETGGHDAAVPGRGARTPDTGDGGGGGSATVAEVVALLSEEPPREYGDDLVAALRAARRGTDGYGARWRAEVRRLRAAGRGTGEGTERSAVERTGEGNAGVTGESAPEEAEQGVGERTGQGAERGTGERNGQGTERHTGERTGQGTERSTGERTGQGTERSTGERTGQGTERNSGGRAGQGAGAGGVRDVTDDGVAGLVTALAYPERVARKDGGSYLMVSGTRAELPEASALRGAPWIAVAVADRPLGRGHARVRLGAVVDEATARRAAGALLEERDEVHWSGGDVVARRVERLGAVELRARPLTSPDPALVRNALLEGVREEGLGLLRRSAEAEALRQRLAFLRHRLGEPWPDVSDDALHARVDEWLEPELSRARRRADLARIDAAQALARLLPWASGEAARLDELAPERITVPSGSRVRVDYGDPARPVLAVKLQEMFGLQHSPEVAGVPLLVHLLSPAGRPAAVTADLASFWKDGYHGVRAELRGRYPKHPWPEDPATAEPTRHTKARLAK